MRKGGFLCKRRKEQKMCISIRRTRYYFRLFVLVKATSESVPDSAVPDSLVQAGVDANVRGSHLLLGKLAHDLDRSRGALLVADLVQASVQVDGALPCHHFIDRRLWLLLTLGLNHLGGCLIKLQTNDTCNDTDFINTGNSQC